MLLIGTSISGARNSNDTKLIRRKLFLCTWPVYQNLYQYFIHANSTFMKKITHFVIAKNQFDYIYKRLLKCCSLYQYKVKRRWKRVKLAAVCFLKGPLLI